MTAGQLQRRRRAHVATLIAAALIIAGFVTIGLAWHSLAALLWIPTQISYAVSGGLAGVAMIGTGLGILNIQSSRVAGARRRGELQELISRSVGVLVALGDGSQLRARRRPPRPPNAEH